MFSVGWRVLVHELVRERDLEKAEGLADAQIDLRTGMTNEATGTDYLPSPSVQRGCMFAGSTLNA